MVPYLILLQCSYTQVKYKSSYQQLGEPDCKAIDWPNHLQLAVRLQLIWLIPSRLGPFVAQSHTSQYQPTHIPMLLTAQLLALESGWSNSQWRILHKRWPPLKIPEILEGKCKCINEISVQEVLDVVLGWALVWRQLYFFLRQWVSLTLIGMIYWWRTRINKEKVLYVIH